MHFIDFFILSNLHIFGKSTILIDIFSKFSQSVVYRKFLCPKYYIVYFKLEIQLVFVLNAYSMVKNCGKIRKFCCLSGWQVIVRENDLNGNNDLWIENLSYINIHFKTKISHCIFKKALDKLVLLALYTRWTKNFSDKWAAIIQSAAYTHFQNKL